MSNDFLKTDEEWQREAVLQDNPSGQCFCHCGKRAHFGQADGKWVCHEHWRSPYKREREASTTEESKP
jgi:hypothetical protein